MKIKDQAVKELESLNPSELAAVYEMITSFKKAGRGEPKPRAVEPAYLSVRKGLAKCKGSLSDDILLLREDRV